MNKTLKSILVTSMISVLTTLSILYLYKEFTGVNVSSKKEPDTLQVDTIKLPDSKNIELVLLLEQQKCLDELLTNEQVGNPFTNTCGSTSGKAGMGTRYKEIQYQIEKVKNEIDSISNLILSEKIGAN
ncbi:hypothetical protein FACS1894123_02940 [Bacteroidia bacterium]|nr:hypothetical protein FACS1894123_02940 [Bacteroidia bacterium]